MEIPSRGGATGQDFIRIPILPLGKNLSSNLQDANQTASAMLDWAIEATAAPVPTMIDI